jgi:hypothetical protein
MSFTKAELDNLLTLISKGDIAALKSEEFDQFQYIGFDPMRIVQSLLRVKNDEKIDDDQFRTDVYKMIAIGIIKGSVNDHNITKMSDTGKNDINALLKKYGIQKGGGRGKASSVITFPRVMATFPDIAVRMVGVIGAKEFNGGPMLSSRLPNYLKVQVFPSVVPRNLNSSVKQMLLMANLCYTIDQSTQISQLKDPDLKSLAATQSNFTNIGHQSPVPNSLTRLTVFKSLNIDEDYDSIMSVIKDYIEKIDPTFIAPDKTAFVKEIRAI